MKKLLLPAALMVAVACTQEPVNVVLKGNQFFGKDGAQTASVSSFTFREETRLSPQPVGGVGVSELPPLGSQVEKDLSEIRLIPASRGEDAGRFTPAALKVESPGVASEVAEDWYQGQVVLARAERAAGAPDAPDFIWPVRGKIISHFGPKANGLHNDGINISAQIGDPVYAAAGGVVVYAGNDLKGYGNMAILRHENGWMSAYAHADQLLVAENERVAQGQRIATVGMSGNAESAQLHFGLRNGKSPVNPAQFLGSDFASAR